MDGLQLRRNVVTGQFVVLFVLIECFLFAKIVCISSLGKEAKRFVCRVDSCFVKVFCLLTLG